MFCDIGRLKEIYEVLLVRFFNFWFVYKDLEKNWNRNCVKGFVVFLISVKDIFVIIVLELVVGEWFYNVVVDIEVIGKKLLERGELKCWYIIILFNKILVRCIVLEILRVV